MVALETLTGNDECIGIDEVLNGEAFWQNPIGFVPLFKRESFYKPDNEMAKVIAVQNPKRCRLSDFFPKLLPNAEE